MGAGASSSTPEDTVVVTVQPGKGISSEAVQKAATKFMAHRLLDMLLPGSGVMLDALDAAQIASELADAGLTDVADDIKETLESGDNDEIMKAMKKILFSKAKRVTCPGGHTCQVSITPSDAFACDGCQHDIGRGSPKYGCRICNWDLCVFCVMRTAGKGGEEGSEEEEGSRAGSDTDDHRSRDDRSDDSREDRRDDSDDSDE